MQRLPFSQSTMVDSGAKAAQLKRWDHLIQALSEENFKCTTNLCDVSATGVDDSETKQEVLAAATDKGMRCAELIAKSLEASGTLCKLQKTLKNAFEHSKEDEHDGVEAMEDEEDDEATTLLLHDLVAAGDEVEDAVKKYARLGVVRKSAQASHKLLALAERDLNEHLANNVESHEEKAVQDEFNQLYMEEFTTVFGDELDQYRQEERFDSKDVSYLISCIQAGADIFSPLQKKLFVESIGATDERVQ